jgi:hypothetical protein
VDATVPPAFQPLLARIPSSLPQPERLNLLCASIATQVESTLEAYRSVMPAQVDFDALKRAYGVILQNWVQAVRAAVDDHDILFPGDIEAGGDVGDLDEESRAAMLEALVARLSAEEQEWEALGAETENVATTATATGGSMIDLPVPLGQGPDVGQLVAQVEAERAEQGGKVGLGTAYGSSVRRIAMDLDRLAATLQSVESLARSADRAADLMQSELVGVTFRGLDHLESPVALIKQLTRQ